MRITPEMHEEHEQCLPPVTSTKTNSRTGSTHLPAGKPDAEGTTTRINHVITGSFPPIGGTSNFWMGCNMVLVVPFHQAPSPAAIMGGWVGHPQHPTPLSAWVRERCRASQAYLSSPHTYFKEYISHECVFQGTEVWMQTDQKILFKMEAQPEPWWKGNSNGAVSTAKANASCNCVLRPHMEKCPSYSLM